MYKTLVEKKHKLNQPKLKSNNTKICYGIHDQYESSYVLYLMKEDSNEKQEVDREKNRPKWFFFLVHGRN